MGNEANPVQAVFLVGCPRSGTTLLQALLGCHPEVLALPETHFFIDVVGMAVYRCRGIFPRHPFRWLHLARQHHRLQRGLVNGDGTQRLLRLAQRIEAPPPPEIAPSENTISGHARHFAAYLDAVARARGTCCWVDKSPNHVFYLAEIEKHLPEARFLHLIRDGRDVTASLCDAMQRYPDWSGRYRGVRGCMRTWNRAVRASAARANHSHHMLVSYEQICEDPAGRMAPIFSFLGLDPRAFNLEGLDRSSRGLIYDYETWKAGVKTGSVKRTSKFRSLFSPAEQARIERGLKWAGRPPEDLFAQAATRNNTT